MSEFKQILTKYWGFAAFRPLQEEIIQLVDQGKDTLGLMPTGGGKSVTYQVYSLSKPGICLVITPLIALMKDQVENLNQRGIKALAIYSGMSNQEIKVAMDHAAWGNYKFLYLSPERIATERFRERIGKFDVNLIAVDEAHCISQWGYDFRPSYLRIAELRDLLPNIPVLAVTATATAQVIDDIQEQLKFKKKNVLRTSYYRSNLIYLVRNEEDKVNYLVKAVQKAKGTGIVYVKSRKLTREISDLLSKNQISADCYHAGLSTKIRSSRQEAWMNGKCRVIVSTNAFGMGIDKADVRFVIHLEAPDSVEAYFQEAGRAGRDGKTAWSVLLYNNSDKIRLHKNVDKSFPEPDVIKRIYEAICNFYQLAVGFGKDQSFEFSMASFASSFSFQITVVFNSLKILQREGYLELTDELDNPSKVYFQVGRDDLYKFQVANAGFDGFIKLLLRSYTGLFTNYVAIDEQLMAQRANISPELVYQFLCKLRAQKVIDYIPQKKTPFIIFTKERIDLDRLKITKENYTDRKRDYMQRIDSMIHYASSGHKCRSQLLLQYFGETESVRCGKCDVCMERNELNVSKYEFDTISDQIKKLLLEPCFYEELIARIEGKPDNTVKIVRWLLENEKIVYRVDNRMEWRKG
ncbi:MAG: ATP-dependent DNA helicase RecQ [Bacteroidota bacterium]|nr:RecQ family ATP-dependent DNA helicase [Odoribacter sp.]MDP3641831.1 ATP-dependent DNA helicase RecQ [Bacteroidota bacterium]